MKLIRVLKNSHPSKSDMRMIGGTLLFVLPFIALACSIPSAIMAGLWKKNFWFIYTAIVIIFELGAGLCGLIGIYIYNIWNNEEST